MEPKEQVLKFINGMKNEGTIKAFTEGYCYWFALILRCWASNCMGWAGCHLVYDPINNHFACHIKGSFYDITGEVTGDYRKWYKYKEEDPAQAEIINQCCIAKIR